MITSSHIAEILPTSLSQIEERVLNKGSLMGVATGFYDLDQYLSGLHPSNLIIVSGRPAMGKSSFSLNIAANVAIRANEPVLIFSLEMSKEQLVQRLLCAEAEIDAQRIRSGEIIDHDFGRIASAMGRLGEAPLFIDETPDLNVDKLQEEAENIAIKCGKLGLIIVDYLQLMEPTELHKSGENRVFEISTISRRLKALAHKLGCPIIALSQMSRAVEGRYNKRPLLTDLRDSGSLEEDADAVLFIYRDDYYNPETERPGTADIIIAKQRNGPVGEVSLLFRNNITKFVNPLDSARMVR